jgi:hypothetical protein
MHRTISYHFDFNNGSAWKFEFEFDEAQHLIPVPAAPEHLWTRLEFNQCPLCPLKKEHSPYCPVARNLHAVVEASQAAVSCTKARVTVTVPERTCVKDCDTQEGLRSLFGLIMASSGCPHLDWLRPLARFHLPFASIEENLFRVLSLQLLEDFLAGSHEQVGACGIKLQARYSVVEKVNHAFVDRIHSYCKADADRNAIAALDVFVQFFQFHLESNFEQLRPYFSMTR